MTDEHLLRMLGNDSGTFARSCRGIGKRLQYSVFISDLSLSELVHARAEVDQEMLMTQDSVMIVDLGEVTAAVPLLSQQRALPASGARVI